ncbi:hypothetical protein [Micromonospora sp. 067-2]|uniref:hypothetical protein n=1 Tax=Micromonospora sp. 067-2 TaxID=2789270 RepID=UPI003978FD04
MTGRRAARDHGDRPTGPTVGDEPTPGGSRGATVAPQPRPVPGDDATGLTATPARPAPAAPPPTPARPTPAAPAPGPDRPTPAAPASSPARPASSGSTDDPSTDGGEPAAGAVEVEPTTGAPVDAVPRRVPVRQQSRFHRGARPLDGDTMADGDGVFWAPIEQVHWDGTPIRKEPAQRRGGSSGAARRRAPARAAPPPDPLPGLTALVLLSLVVAFFAWVSAGPFWLAVGHARVGTVLIDDCTGGGLTQRCRGIFASDDGRLLAHGIRVSGVPAGKDAPGTALPARMTGPNSATAYADTGLSRHLRWVPGLLVILACAAGIARWTGSTRLAGRRNRRWAVTVAVAGPALLTLGFLAAAW